MNNNKLDIILNKLEKIESDINKIKKDISVIKQQTSKMDNHVDFVNTVYEKVEAPLNYVTSKYYSLMGTDHEKNMIE